MFITNEIIDLEIIEILVKEYAWSISIWVDLLMSECQSSDKNIIVFFLIEL